MSDTPEPKLKMVYLNNGMTLICSMIPVVEENSLIAHKPYSVFPISEDEYGITPMFPESSDDVFVFNLNQVMTIGTPENEIALNYLKVTTSKEFNFHFSERNSIH